MSRCPSLAARPRRGWGQGPRLTVVSPGPGSVPGTQGASIMNAWLKGWQLCGDLHSPLGLDLAGERGMAGRGGRAVLGWVSLAVLRGGAG